MIPSPRWRKVLRDLVSSKTRTVLVVLSIAIGVFAVGAIAGTRAILMRDLPAAYLASNPASAVVFAAPFDDDLVRVARNVPGVGAAEGRGGVEARVQVGPGEWRSIWLVAIPDFDDMQVATIQPQAGAWPPARTEMLVERSSLDQLPGGIGSAVTVRLPDGEERSLRLSGTVHNVGIEPTFFSGIVYAYITFDTLEWLGEPRAYTQLHLTTAEQRTDAAHIRTVAAQVADKIEKSGRMVAWTRIPTPMEHPLDPAVQAMLLLLGVLGALAVALSAFLVINTIGAVLAQQVRQIGMMKSVGARRSQVIGIYTGMVLAFGLLSLVVAVPLGLLATRLLSDFAAGLLNFDISDYRMQPAVLAIQALVALLVPLVAALVPILSGTSVTVREALTSYGLTLTQVTGWQVHWARWSGQVFGFLGRPTLLSIRNTFRRRGRLTLTLVTLSLGGAIFIAVLSVQASLNRTLDDALRYWNYNVEVNFLQAYRTDRIEGVALQVPGVARAESWLFESARIERTDGSESDSIVLIAPPAATSMLEPDVLSGRWLLPEDENALVINTELLRREPGLAVGDRITLVIDDRTTSWQIVGMVRGVLAGPSLYANYQYAAEVVRDVGRAQALRVATVGQDAESEAEVALALERAFEQAGMRISSRQTTSDQRDLTSRQFNTLVLFLMIMAVLLAAVGGLGLMGTMSINVLERTREIGVMRAIGASNGAVQRVVLTEGMLIGMLSWLLGTLASLPISVLLSNAVGVAFTQAPLTYAFSTDGALLWLGVAAAISALASFLPAWRASWLSVREVLAYE